jgi:cbb3-type cytochrome oxidase cytochrome c subunit/cytochrome c553
MTPQPARALRMSYLVASVAGVAFFVMSVAWLGVWPARALAEQARLTGPEHVLPLTSSEARGRVVYAREGCAYCHTQQIRFTSVDITRFGAPTLAWEGRGDTPHMLGTRRIGPDLSRASGTRSPDWHFTHLYSPRSVVSSSVMPAYRSLFSGGPDAPTQEARDLVAYLETLGRARALGGPDAHTTGAPDSHMRDLAAPSALSAHPARAHRGDAVPSLAADGDVALGATLFQDHCAACHGTTGAGDGPGAAGLRPRPTNLRIHSYTLDRVAEALWNGVAGTSMPAWRDRSPQDLSSLAAFVRQLSQTNDAPVSEQSELGARVYAANCVQCHGAGGAGDGPAAALLPIVPTNFLRQALTVDEILRVLRDGIDGTPMAPWTSRLGEEELAAVARHVRGLYR